MLSVIDQVAQSFEQALTPTLSARVYEDPVLATMQLWGRYGTLCEVEVDRHGAPYLRCPP
jgi:hypothetical protein